MLITIVGVTGCDVSQNAQSKLPAPTAHENLPLETLVYSPPNSLGDEEAQRLIIEHYLSQRPSAPSPAYVSIHRYAAKAIPAAVEIEKHFAHVDHFITHFGIVGGTTIWNTEAFFGDRYILTLQVPIKIDYASNTFAIAGEPLCILCAARECERRGSIQYDTGEQRTFSPSQLDMLISSQWDWACVGVRIHDTPVKWFPVCQAMKTSPRVKISLR